MPSLMHFCREAVTSRQIFLQARKSLSPKTCDIILSETYPSYLKGIKGTPVQLPMLCLDCPSMLQDVQPPGVDISSERGLLRRNGLQELLHPWPARDPSQAATVNPLTPLDMRALILRPPPPPATSLRPIQPQPPAPLLATDCRASLHFCVTGGSPRTPPFTCHFATRRRMV